MKTFVILTTILVSFYVAMAEDPELNVKSEIKSVTVFMSGSEINHTAGVVLKKGKNRINFVGLSPKLESKSITVNIDQKDVTILSVYSRTNYLSTQSENPKITI